MELFDLKRVKEDIEEKENFYKAEALESYLLYMWKHYSKIANRLYEDYMELIRKESKTPDSSHSNFLAIKEVLNDRPDCWNFLSKHPSRYNTNCRQYIWDR